MNKRVRKKLRAMRKIVVDGESWRWCVARESVGGWSEYTPGLPVLNVYLRTAGGRLLVHRSEDVTDDETVTPAAIAEFIRKVKREEAR